LVGTILAFAKGIYWHVDKEINLKITDLSDPKTVKVKYQKLMGFQSDKPFHYNKDLGKNLDVRTIPNILVLISMLLAILSILGPR